MGPSTNIDGEESKPYSSQTAYVLLQWGRRRTSTESDQTLDGRARECHGFNGAVDEHRRRGVRIRALVRARVEASMGPSTNIDGEVPVRPSRSRASTRFNGAVDEHRRRERIAALALHP